MAEILWLTKRRYMGKDLLSDEFGRYWEIPHRLAEMDHRLHVLALAYRNEPDERRVESDQLIYESIHVRRFLKYLFRAVQIIRHQDVALVIGAADVHFCILAYVLARGFGRRVFFDLYDHYEHFAAGRLPPLRWLYNKMMGRTDANVIFSQSLVDHLSRQVPQPNHWLVVSGVDKTVFRPLDRSTCRERYDLPSDEILIGYFGAVSESRGIGVLFAAAEILREGGSTCRLVLAGPADPELELGESSGSIYLGQLDQAAIPYLINACDVNVICYKEDDLGKYSFPVKAFEYIACQVPLATPAIGEMVDFLEEYPEYLYPVSDASELARTISSLLSSPEHRFPEVPGWRESAMDYSKCIAQVCPPPE